MCGGTAAEARDETLGGAQSGSHLVRVRVRVRVLTAERQPLG